MAWRVTFAFGLMLFALTSRLCFSQSEWLLSNRLQVGGEHDDNIFESSARPTSAYSGRLLFSSRADRSWQRSQLSVAYSGGLQTYASHTVENKLTNEANAETRWNVSRWCQLRGAVNGTLKIYLNDQYDYGTTQSTLSASLQLPQRFSLTLSTATARLDYADSDFFDFMSRSYGVTLRRQLAGWLTAEGGVNHSRLNYLRYVYLLDNAKQRDRQNGAAVRFVIGRKFLVNISGEWQRNNSNNAGYDYERWRLSLIGAVRLSPRWLLRIAALRQHKKYLEAQRPLNPIELDAERNESNFIVADLSYDLSSQVGWLLRVSYYDNEAAFRGLFYQKTVLFSGVEYRF